MKGWSSRVEVIVSALMLVVAGGCEVSPLPIVVERPTLESCSATFEEVLGLGIRESAPKKLTFDRGVLYYSDGARVQSVPLDGRPPWTVVQTYAPAFWIE